MDLNIVPINYDKRGLEEIVGIIHNAFPGFFDNFVVQQSMNYSNYKDALNYRPDKNLRYFLREDMLNLLDEFEKPVLGMTSYMVVQEHNCVDTLYCDIGFGESKRANSFVSVYPSALSKHEESIRRTGIECAHELGHLFGLQHHLNCNDVPAKNSLCIMDISHRILLKQRKINVAQYIDARKTEFCEECKNKLQKSSYSTQQFF